MITLMHPLSKEERWRKVDLSKIATDPDAFELLNLEKSKLEPIGIEGDKTLTIRKYSEDEEIFFPRIQVRLDGHLKLIEENHRKNGIIAAVTSIEVMEDSSLDYLGVMKYHNSPSFSVRRFILHENAKAHINFFYEGGAGGKERIEIWLLGDHSEAELSGISTLSGSEHINIDTLQSHQGVSSKSDLLFLGINRGAGKGIFEGMIRVEKRAMGSSSRLSQDHLLTGSFAKAESIPRLEILADDVTCSHKATVSRPDSDELFYLKSRGLSEESAVGLIEEGFKKTALERLGKSNERDKETVSDLR